MAQDLVHQAQSLRSIPDRAVVLSGWLVALVLVYSGLEKLIITLTNHYPSIPLPGWIIVLVSAVELGVGVMLFHRPGLRWSHGAALAILSGYAVYSLSYLRFSSVLDCGCGLPRVISPTDPSLLVARNTFLAMLALPPAVLAFRNRWPSRSRETQLRNPLALLTLLLVVQLLGLSRLQEGESSTGVSYLLPQHDTPVYLGDRIARRMDELLGRRSKDYLLVYVSPKCGECIRRCSELKDLMEQSWKMGFDAAVVTQAPSAEMLLYREKCSLLTPILYDTAFEVGRILGVHETPFIALVRNRRSLVAIGINDIADELDRIKSP